MISFDFIQKKIKGNQRISEEEALFLFHYEDIFSLGRLADSFNQSLNHKYAYYSKSCYLGFPKPSFLSSSLFLKVPFSVLAGSLQGLESEGYEEIFIEDNFWGNRSLESCLEFISMLSTSKTNLKLKSFTPSLVNKFSLERNISVKEVLLLIKQAGVSSLLGFDSNLVVGHGFSTLSRELSSVYETALSCGLKVHGTMFYEKSSDFSEMIDQLSFFRDLQDRASSASSFIFSPYFSSESNEKTSGIDDLRAIAISRLFLDNVQHIQANVAIYGQDLAGFSLSFGASHLGSCFLTDEFDLSKTSLSAANMDEMILRSKQKPFHSKSSKNIDDTKEASIKERIDSGDSLEDNILFAESHSIFSLEKMIAIKNRSFSLENKLGFSFGSDLSLEDDDIYFSSGKVFRVDLSSYERKEEDLLYNWSRLKGILKQIRMIESEKQVVLSGFQFIWQVAQLKRIKLQDVFLRLRNLGVDVIESSSKEFEGGLTNSEIINLHREAHLAGILTTAKLELSLGFDGLNFLWKSFIQKIHSYIELQKITRGIKAFMIEPAIDSTMTMSEFLYAFSVAKYFLRKGGHSARLIVPIERFPLLNPRGSLNEKFRFKSHPKSQNLFRDKFLTLLSHLGVDDLGFVKSEDFSEGFLLGLFSDLHSSDLKCVPRDAFFSEINLADSALQALQSEVKGKDCFSH